MSAETSEKWSCNVCTYDSYQSSLKCVMCRTPKAQIVYRIHDKPQPQPIEASGDIDGCDKVVGGSNAVDTPQEPFNADVKISKRAHSPANEEASSGGLEARALAKWSCAACMYQNWPKSLKCIMCGTRGPRNRSPSPDHSLCKPPAVTTKRVKSPEKDLAATINTDSNIYTLKSSGESSEDDSGESSEDDSGESSEDDSGESSEDDSGESSEDDSGESSEDDSVIVEDEHGQQLTNSVPAQWGCKSANSQRSLNNNGECSFCKKAKQDDVPIPTSSDSVRIHRLQRLQAMILQLMIFSMVWLACFLLS